MEEETRLEEQRLYPGRVDIRSNKPKGKRNLLSVAIGCVILPSLFLSTRSLEQFARTVPLQQLA
jgi:hypothetical protein